MGNLPKVVVSLDNDRESVSFSLYRNINILSDKSGAGKTNMVSKLVKVLQNNLDIDVYGYYEGNKVKYSIIPVTVAVQIGTEDDFNCYIFDDVKGAFFNEKVYNMYTRAKKSVFLFISRGQSEGYKDRFVSFADAVYNLNYSKRGKKEYFSFSKCMDSFSESSYSADDTGSCLTCLCEGSSGCSENMLYSTLFAKVECAEGRHNISTVLARLSKRYSPGSNLYVMVDLCGFGDCLEEFISECLASNINITLANIDSFEYMMMEAVFPSKFEDLQNINTDYVNGMTYEAYVSSQLFSTKFGLCNWFSKDRVPVALTLGCEECNPYKRDKCVFRSSLYERIISMCKNSKEFCNIVLLSRGGAKYAKSISGFHRTVK